MELQAFVDWFQFTVKGQLLHTVFDKILKIPQSQFENIGRGMQGYKISHIYNKIIVLSDGNSDMGVHVIMSSGAIALYSVENCFFRLLSRVLVHDTNISRIDIAIDDYRGNILQMEKIKADIVNGCVISKWRTYSRIEKKDLQSLDLQGETLYFGSRTSEICMRIYRKDLEQKSTDPARIGWTRLELEFKGDKARKVASQVHVDRNILHKDDSTSEIHAILNNYIRFLAKGDGKNKSRWRTAPHWQRFLITADKIQLSTKKEVKTLNDVKSWIHSQVATSLAMMIDSAQGDLSEIIAYALDGKGRYKDKHKRMLEEYASKMDALREE